jgi:uncharacterized protein YmfQ (DUF2313 family)
MPAYGEYTPGAERYGGDTPRIRTILDALNAARGTAYDVTEGSPVWVENMAIARAMADVFDTNAMLANQFDPKRMTVLLPRWESICGIAVTPGTTDADRRAAVAVRIARLGSPTIGQYVIDQVAALLGPVSFSLTHNPSSTPGAYLASYADSWYLQERSITNNTVALSGTPAAAYSLVVSVTATGGQGAATFSWSPDGGATTYGPVVANNGIMLGSTGLRIDFPYVDKTYGIATYSVGETFLANPDPHGATSTIARITIACAKPAWMPYDQFYSLIGPVKSFLDDVLPAWSSFNITLDGPHGAGFYLDEPNNLDNQRLV